MTPKTKFTLIGWWIISFIWWWMFLVMSLIPSNNDVIKNPRNYRFQHDVLWKAPTSWDIENNIKNNIESTKTTEKKEDKKEEKIVREEHKLKLLTISDLNSTKAWKLFNIKYKAKTWWEIDVKYYKNISDYNKDLIYKLATKNTDFDLAIIPSEWFKNTEELTKLSFKLWNSSFAISSIFDYNFNYLLKNNQIKAIPFAIDPIIGYSTNRKLDTKQTFDTWKKLILDSNNRIDSKWNLRNIPLLLWYDKDYLNYIKKSGKTIFPVFDYILEYYIFKKDRSSIELIKDFWTNIVYKTFSFKILKKNLLKIRKIPFCKWTFWKYCLLLWNKSKLVYWFASDYNLFRKNAKNIYKTFHLKTSNLYTTSLALPMWGNSEYPARWRVIIINPNSKNIKYIWNFLKQYIIMWKNNTLPFYRNMISPFLTQYSIKNSKFLFLNDYSGRFITLDKIWIWLKNSLNKKTINYLNWDISVDILLK